MRKTIAIIQVGSDKDLDHGGSGEIDCIGSVSGFIVDLVDETYMVRCET